MKSVFRRALLAAAIIVALLPLVELGDRWESYGSDPEFVSVVTVAVVCLGFLLFPREVVSALRRLFLREHVSTSRAAKLHTFLFRLIQEGLPDIRAPIRI